MSTRSGRKPMTELQGRWRTLQLLGPVFELLNRGAPRAEFDHRSYDLAQLALRLIDYVVLNQATLEGAVTPNAAVDHLTQLARRMHPEDPDRPWAKVARLVLTTVLNGGRPHKAMWVEAESEYGAMHTELFRFRLLRLVDNEVGACITATDEAIVLYLRALDTDLADQALALKLMVEIQMNAGEFEKALESARQATRTAQGLSARLREKLADTRRDVSAVDWHGECRHGSPILSVRSRSSSSETTSCVSSRRVRPPILLRPRPQYFVEVGRAHAAKKQYRDSMYALLRAEHTAPQHVRNMVMVQELVGHMMRTAKCDLTTGELARLAQRVGVVPA